MGGREGLEVRLESNFKTALKVTENKRDFLQNHHIFLSIDCIPDLKSESMRLTRDMVE